MTLEEGGRVLGSIVLRFDEDPPRPPRAPKGNEIAQDLVILTRDEFEAARKAKRLRVRAQYFGQRPIDVDLPLEGMIALFPRLTSPECR